MASLACLLAFAFPALADAQPAPYKLPPVSYLENGDARQADFSRHKLTILHFWATWCPPCIPELEDVQAITEKYGDDLQIIAISMDADEIAVKKLLAEKKLSRVTPFLDNQSQSFRAAQVKGLPSTLFIDQDGRVLHHASGPVRWKEKQTTGFIEKRLK